MTSGLINSEMTESVQKSSNSNQYITIYLISHLLLYLLTAFRLHFSLKCELKLTFYVSAVVKQYPRHDL